MRLSVFERDGFRILNLGPEGWTGAAAERYVAGHCDGVMLEPGKPFADLDFLRPLPGLRLLGLGAAEVRDPTALFTKVELEELGAGLTLKDLRGLERLTRLRTLAVPFRKGIEGVGVLTGLRSLGVEEWPPGTGLDLLSDKPELSELTLAFKRTAEVSSAWFRTAPVLTKLSLYSGRLTDTGGLAALTRLESLRLADTKVADLDFVAAMPALRELDIDNAGEIASLAPLRGLPKLSWVRILGRTSIADGDLSPLDDLPALTTVTAPGRR